MPPSRQLPLTTMNTFPLVSSVITRSIRSTAFFLNPLFRVEGIEQWCYFCDTVKNHQHESLDGFVLTNIGWSYPARFHTIAAVFAPNFLQPMLLKDLPDLSFSPKMIVPVR